MFYVLSNAFHMSAIAAGLISGVVPAIRTIVTIVTKRTVDVLGLVMLTLFVVGGVVSVSKATRGSSTRRTAGSPACSACGSWRPC